MRIATQLVIAERTSERASTSKYYCHIYADGTDSPSIVNLVVSTRREGRRREGEKLIFPHTKLLLRADPADSSPFTVGS